MFTIHEKEKNAFPAFKKLGRIYIESNSAEPLFRGHPRDRGKCPLNRGWAGVC